MGELIIDKSNQEIIDLLKKLNREGFKNLLILGSVGTGKTFLTSHFISHDYFIDEPTFKQNIVSGNARLMKPEEFGSSVKGFPLEALSRCPSIIYDDIGTVELSEAYIEKTLYWLNERAKSKTKRTVFTTNLTIEELEKREKRIYSRIIENAVILQMNGQDRRKSTVKILTI